MTREEAKTIILKHQFAFASMPDDVIEAINYLVKEEPFINKPCCISGEVCEHDKNAVLDKIRAEILEDCGYSKDYVGAFTYSTIKVETVLQILDKYKVESEDKE